MTWIFKAALAATLVAGPAMAQRHADLVYLQQHKAKQAQQQAEAAARPPEVAAAPTVSATPPNAPAEPKANGQDKPSR
jgi:hypothetical protein